jgi:hypothetical protein
MIVSPRARYEPPPVCGRSLFLFSGDSLLRLAVHRLMFNKVTEALLLVIILVNTFCMILASPPPEKGTAKVTMTSLVEHSQPLWRY